MALMANTGDAFEQQVAAYLKKQLGAGRFGLDPKQAQIFRKKSYPSSRRQGGIITDVSVELTRPGAASPWLVWVIECKDLGHNVPVDDIEEFHNKLQQMDLHKGTMFARHGFAQGVLEYAASAKIGLVRMKTPGAATVLMETTGPLSVRTALTTAPEDRLEAEFYGRSREGLEARGFERFVRSELREVFGADER